MNITTTYEVSTSAEFAEAVARLGGECTVAPDFDDNRTITIVDEEEWESDEDYDEVPAGEPPWTNGHPDDARADHME